MPIKIVRDPKTGEEVRTYVPEAPAAAAPAKPQQAGNTAAGVAYDLSPLPLVNAVGAGAQAFMQTGNLGSAWEAGMREVMKPAVTPLGKSIARTTTAAAQKAVDPLRYEVERSRLARQAAMPALAAGDAAGAISAAQGIKAKDVKIANAPLPGWANYDDARPKNLNPVEDTASSILAFIPYFVAAKGVAAPGVAAAAELPGISQGLAAAKNVQAGLMAGGPASRFFGTFAKEAVEGAIPSAIATYIGQDPTQASLTDTLYQTTKGTPFEKVVVQALRSDPSDTVQQARTKAAINDLVWSIPLGGGLGTAATGIGRLASKTKEAIADVLAKQIQVAQAEQAVGATAAAPTAAPTAPVTAPAAGATPAVVKPPVRQVTGRRAVDVYAGMRRPAMFEQQGVQIQGRIPEAGNIPAQSIPAGQQVVDVQAAPIPDPWTNLEQAQASLKDSVQRMQAEVAKEAYAAPVATPMAQGQLPDLAQPTYQELATIPTQGVVAAPKIFQFKAEGQNKTGRSGSLVDTSNYNPDLAGIISVWRDERGEVGPAGTVYVVNGHNRLELANRSGTPVVNVRYLQANTAAEARTIGALQNIADERGTAVDAGKLIRDAGMTPEQVRATGLDLSGRTATEGVALSRLPQWLFDKVATGDVPTAKGVALGSAEGADQQVITDIAKKALKANWSAEKITQAMQEAKFATTTADGGGIPGMEDWFKSSNVEQLAEVRSSAFRLLSEEMRALAAASRAKNTEYLQAAGNVIDVAGSQAARKVAAEAVAVFNRVTSYEGPVRAILNELADQVPSGKTMSSKAGELVAANIDRLRAAIDEEVNGPGLKFQETAAPVPAAAVAPEPSVPSAGTPAPAAAAPAPTPAPVEIPPAAIRKLSSDPGRIQTSADILMGKVNRLIGPPVIGSRQEAISILQAKGQILDLWSTPELGDRFSEYNNDMAMGRQTPLTEQVRDMYMQFYGLKDNKPSAIQASMGGAGNGAPSAGTPAPAAVAPAPTPAAKPVIDKAIFDKAFAHLSPEKRAEIFAGLQQKGAVTSNPSPINEPTVAFTAKPPRSVPEFALPADLAGAKNNYRYGQKAFTIEFANDLDRTAYYLAGDATGKQSKAAAKYIAALEGTGLDPKDVAAYGRQVVKPAIKEMARTAQPGVLKLADQGFGGGRDLSVELPGLPPRQGRVGEDYTGQVKISPADMAEIEMAAARIAGLTPQQIQIAPSITGAFTPEQAAAYGERAGASFQAAGSFESGFDPKDDALILAMVGKSGPLTFVSQMVTTFHEAFHRLQRRYLTPNEIAVLLAGDKAIREFAARPYKYQDGSYTDWGQQLTDPGHPQYLSSREAQAFAFQRVWRDTRFVATTEWGKVMEKMAKFAEAVGNGLKGRGFQTWDDVFDKAFSGEYAAQRTPRRGMGPSFPDELAQPTVSLAVEPPDPAEFARRVEQNMNNLESGDMTTEDITKMMASDVRRLASPSGKTSYVPNAPDTLIASNRALGEMLRGRAEATGIASFSESAVVRSAINQLRGDQFDVGVTVQRLEAARRGDPRSQDDLVALAGTLIHRDHLADQNAVTALEWQQAVDEADQSTAMQRLFAGMEDQFRLDTALMTASRKDAQNMRVMQIRVNYDPTMLEVPAGMELHHGTTGDAADSILSGGFKAGPTGTSLLGDGVYFSEGPAYAGAYGDTDVYGSVDPDIRILDLASMNKRIADLVQELGLGRMEKAEGGFSLTAKQKQSIKSWAIGEGYQGIRFTPDFVVREADKQNVPEVVIYDINAANRIVGSDAAAYPDPKLPPESIDQTVATEVADPLNALLGKFEPEIRADIQAGNVTPETEAITQTLAEAAIASRQSPGFKGKFGALLKGVDPGKLNQEMFLQAFRAARLWSAGTWLKMTVGSAYRTATLPVAQAIPALGTAAIQATKGQNLAAYQSLRRAGLNMAMYGKYAANFTNAFRLMGDSFVIGENLGNLGASSMELAQRGFDEADQLRLDGGEFKEIHDPRNTLDTPWYINPETNNNAAIATRWAWRVLNISGRVSGSLDTFYSSLVGPSAEWARLIDLELGKAEGKGLQGDRAWEAASKIVDQKLESQWRDVNVNGRAIENGALTGLHAKTVMDWVNFTDDLDVQFQPRTYEYGIRKAKEEGLTNVNEVNSRAIEWMNEEPDAMAKAGLGMAKGVSVAPRIVQWAVNQVPILGILQAFNRGPANIVKAGMRATGFAAPFVDTFHRDLNSEDVFTRERAMGEIAVGAVTLSTAVALATSGYVEMTGPGSYNSKVREKMRSNGTQPYSIRLRNPVTGEFTRWFDLQALDSISNVFAAVGSYMDMANNMPAEDREVLGSNLVLTVAEVIRQVGVSQFTKNMYAGLNEIVSIVQDTTDQNLVAQQGRISPWASLVERRLAGFLPAIFSQARKGVDPYERVVESSGLPGPFNFFHELAQTMANQLPGLSKTLEPRLHPLTGEPIPTDQKWGTTFLPEDQPWLRGFVNTVDPTSFTTTRMGSADPVDNELARLSGRGTSFQIWNANEFNLPNFRLSQSQLNKLATITSQYVAPSRSVTLHGSLSILFAPNSPYWNLPTPEPSKATSSSRAINVNREINYYKKEIKKEFLASEPGVARMVQDQQAAQAQSQFTAEYGVTTQPWSPTP